MEKKEIIEKAFNEIVAKGIIDSEEDKKIIKLEDMLSEIPEKVYKHINKGGKGDSFVFSAYLIKLLYDENILSTMVITQNCSESKASVLYMDEGEFYIANPIADIEEFTKKDIPSVLRNFIINSPENKYKNSRIPLQEFADEFGQVSSLRDFYSNRQETFGSAMAKTVIVAKPAYTIGEFIKESKPSLYCEKRPEVTCMDGYKFSVQASEFHCSEPRMDGLDEYSEFEVSGVSENKIKELAEWEENPEEEFGIYQFVPIDKINEIIEKHGGLNKKVIQKAIRDLKNSYKSQNTRLDQIIEETAGGNEYLANILRYATRKCRLTQEDEKMQQETNKKNGVEKGGQK